MSQTNSSSKATLSLEDQQDMFLFSSPAADMLLGEDVHCFQAPALGQALFEVVELDKTNKVVGTLERAGITSGKCEALPIATHPPLTADFDDTGSILR
jgi:hypothetical protein